MPFLAAAAPAAAAAGTTAAATSPAWVTPALTTLGTVAGGGASLAQAAKSGPTPQASTSTPQASPLNFGQQQQVPQNLFGSPGQSSQGYSSLLQQLAQLSNNGGR